MTDKEMLELAAKAIKAKPDEIAHDGTHWFGRAEWNPLADNGDAFGLSLRLKMTIRHEGEEVAASVALGPTYTKEPTLYVRAAEPIGSDPAAAARRAIVRVAAEFATRNKV